MNPQAKKMMDAATLAAARGFQDFAKARARGQFLTIKDRDHFVAFSVVAAINSRMTDMEDEGATHGDLLQALADALEMEPKHERN